MVFDAIHNHFHNRSIYERYVRRVGLELFEITSRPTSRDDGARVDVELPGGRS